MLALITPTIGWSLVAIALDDLAAASPECLKRLAHGARRAVRPLSRPDALNLRALVVMRHQAAPVVIFDLDVILVAPHAVQLRRGREFREEAREGG